MDILGMVKLNNKSVWKLKEAIEIIELIQFRVQKKSNFHIALAGSVLNNGISSNDLDLIALPMCNGEESSEINLLLELRKCFGYKPELKSSSHYLGKENSSGINRQIYTIKHQNKLIDLFVWNPIND